MKECIVRANEIQLELIGCSRDLTNKKVLYIKDYVTGFSLIKYKPEFKLKNINLDFEEYDIPTNWLEILN